MTFHHDDIVKLWGRAKRAGPPRLAEDRVRRWTYTRGWSHSDALEPFALEFMDEKPKKVLFATPSAAEWTEYAFDDQGRLLHARRQAAQQSNASFRVYGDLVHQVRVSEDELVAVEIAHLDDLGRVVEHQRFDGSLVVRRTTVYTAATATVKNEGYTVVGDLLEPSPDHFGHSEVALDELSRAIRISSFRGDGRSIGAIEVCPPAPDPASLAMLLAGAIVRAVHSRELSEGSLELLYDPGSPFLPGELRFIAGQVVRFLTIDDDAVTKAALDASRYWYLEDEPDQALTLLKKVAAKVRKDSGLDVRVVDLDKDEPASDGQSASF